MAIDFYGDIAVSSKSGSVFFALGLDDTQPTARDGVASPVKTFTTGNTPWAFWGEDNMLPQVIADDIENIGVLDAALDAKGRIGTGKGIQPFLLTNITTDGKEELEWVNDSEILDWLEANESFEFAVDSVYDKLGYGWNCGSFVLNRGQKKIDRVKRHDVYEARLEKKEALSRRINNLYLSADWAKASGTYDPKKQVRIEMLEEGNELADINDRIANNRNSLEFAFAKRTIRNGRHYYPQPTYRSNRAWLKIARSVPAFKIAMFRHQITLNYKITIHPKFWEDKAGQLEWAKYTPAERKQVQEEYYDMIDQWLSGENKAYKSLFTGGFLDHDGKFWPYVDVEVIDDKMKDGKFLPDSGAAIAEILFALMINPALMGAGNPGGNAYGDTSGGSNVRETFLVQMMLMEAERKSNAGPLNVVKNFNGWSKRLEVTKTVVPTAGAGEATPESKIIKPRLVWRYQSGLLTTLDTGKSTKPENL